MFELERTLPDDDIQRKTSRLIGFKKKYTRISKGLLLAMRPEKVQEWSMRHFRKISSLCDLLTICCPLFLFFGDPGVGKTACAIGIADALARELGVDIQLFTLSTRVKGFGLVGQMTALINSAFDAVIRQAGKSRRCVLIIDEADSLIASRNSDQMHHEDRSAVNALIQRLDDLARFNGRVIVILCTNLYSIIDPAVARRAAAQLEFARPFADERRRLFELDLGDLELSAQEIDKLVDVTGPSPENGRLGFTHSDLRMRLIRQVILECCPDRRPSLEDFMNMARELKPTPTVDDMQVKDDPVLGGDKGTNGGLILPMDPKRGKLRAAWRGLRNLFL